MSETATTSGPLIHPGEWHIHYDYAVGNTAERFFTELRDNMKVYARRCPSCERAFVPPRAYCEKCFVRTTDWVEIGPHGVIEAFTIVYEPFDGLPTPPYAVAYVTLDGSSTAVANFVTGVDLTDPETAAAELAVGRRVVVAFAGQREGAITDFHFELLGQDK